MTKDELIQEIHWRWASRGVSDWRERRGKGGYEYLVFVSDMHREALAVGGTETCRLSDKGLADLLLELARLGGVAERYDPMVLPMTADVASVYRDSPITSSGTLRFSALVEMCSSLEAFKPVVEQVWLGNASSIWKAGSDLEGYPTEEDALVALQNGRASSALIDFIGRSPSPSLSAIDALKKYSHDSDFYVRVRALAIRMKLEGVLDVGPAVEVLSPSNINRFGARTARRLLTEAVRRGDDDALAALWAFSKNDLWMRFFEPRWRNETFRTAADLKAWILNHVPPLSL